MDEKRFLDAGEHNLIMEGREKLSLTGVMDVNEFNESVIILNTNMGDVTVEGDNLKINKLSTETGEMNIEGTINSIFYSDGEGNNKRGSFWSKVFR